ASRNSGAAARAPGTFAELSPDWGQSAFAWPGGTVMTVAASAGSGVMFSWNGLIVMRAAFSSSDRMTGPLPHAMRRRGAARRRVRMTERITGPVQAGPGQHPQARVLPGQEQEWER